MTDICVIVCVLFHIHRITHYKCLTLRKGLLYFPVSELFWTGGTHVNQTYLDFKAITAKPERLFEPK